MASKVPARHGTSSVKMFKYILRDQLILLRKFNFLPAFHVGVCGYKEGNKIPIIILKGFPGLWDNSDEVKYFQEKGFPVYVMDFGLQLRSIDYYENKLFELSKQFDRYSLVGYSMGGIICLRHATKRGCKKINRIIAITSPLDGINASKLLQLIPALRDVGKNSSVLNSIRKHSFPKHKVVYTYPEWDQYLNPLSGGLLKNAISIEKPVCGHGYSHLLEENKDVFEKYL